MIKRRLMFIYDLEEDELDLIIKAYKRNIILYKKLIDKRNFVINNCLNLNNRNCFYISKKKDIFKKIVYLYKINMLHILDYLPVYLNITTYVRSMTLNHVLDNMIISINDPKHTFILTDVLKNSEYIKKYSNKKLSPLIDKFNEVISSFGDNYDSMLKEVFNEMFLYIIFNCKDNDYTVYIDYLDNIKENPVRFYEKIKMNNINNNLNEFFNMELLNYRKVLIIK